LDHPRNEMASDLLNLATAKTGRFKIYLKIYSGYLERMQTQMNPQEVSLTKKSPVLVWVIISPQKLKDTSCLFHAISNQLSRMEKPLKTASQLCTKVTSFLQNNPTAPNGIHFREFVNHGGWETYLSSMSMDGRWRDPTALHGMVNILCISAAVVSFSLREGSAQYLSK